MVRSFLLLWMIPLLAGGCIPQQALQDFIGDTPKTTLVPANTVGEGTPPPQTPPVRSSYAQANGETAFRVDLIGRKVLTANPQVGLQPLFITLGSPTAEIFHRGVGELEITEGLVRQCPTEGQLAAVLCYEMGKMVAEREALAGPRTRKRERYEPPGVSYGNAGQLDAADQVRLAEVVKFDQERQRSVRPLPPPDPRVLARLYLKNAGYAETELDGVAPLLQQAQGNFSLEKQIKGAGPAPPWNPAR